MRLFPVGLFVLAASAAAGVQGCGNPITDDSRADRRLFAPEGIIRGTITYQGPHPCSQNGHIVGGAIVLVFDARNPPPPKGLATTAVNFGVVAGDALFANEPRNPGPDMYCPKDHGITDTILASASYTISPMDPAVYIEQAFYDYTGEFFPLLNVKRLPEYGDTLGGYIDVIDAAKHPNDANYVPNYLPITVGVPDPAHPGSLVIPNNGFVAANVAVSIAVPAPFPRPYFYPSNAESPDNAGGMDANGNDTKYLGGSELDALPTGPKADYSDFPDSAAKQGAKPHTGSTEMDPNYIPVITMTQDHKVYAQPRQRLPANVDLFQASFKQIRINAGLPAAEVPTALNPADPYRFQIIPPPAGGIFQWGNYDPVLKTIVQIPEGVIPQIWPLVVFAKLQDDPPGAAPHSSDPGGLLVQGDATHPAVIIQAITLAGDRLLDTVLNAPPSQPTPPGTDHFTALIRPSAICFDATNAATFAAGGVLVTPFQQAPSPDPGENPRVKDILPVDLISRPGVKGLVRRIDFGCMPKGRYAMNVVYPDSQAWTTPNEAGRCQGTEGTTVFGANPLDPTQNSCSAKSRHVLYSQGTRAILEIVDAADPANCQGTHAVPQECCPVGYTVNGGNCVPPGQ